MQKFSLYILSVILIAAISSCNDVSNGITPVADPEVKSISVWKVNDQDVKQHLHRYKEFDENGKLIEFCEFFENGTVQSKSTYSWENNVSSEVKIHYNPSGEQVETDLAKYTYNGNNLISKELMNDNGQVTKVLTYNYDQEGRLVKTIEKSTETGTVSETQYNYQFNTSGNLVEKVTLDQSGVIKGRDSLTYYGDLNRIDVFNFAPEGTLNTKSSFIYDSYGRIRLEIESDSQGNRIRRFIYEYEFFNPN